MPVRLWSLPKRELFEKKKKDKQNTSNIFCNQMKCVFFFLLTCSIQNANIVKYEIAFGYTYGRIEKYQQPNINNLKWTRLCLQIQFLCVHILFMPFWVRITFDFDRMVSTVYSFGPFWQIRDTHRTAIYYNVQILENSFSNFILVRLLDGSGSCDRQPQRTLTLDCEAYSRFVSFPLIHWHVASIWRFTYTCNRPSFTHVQIDFLFFCWWTKTFAGVLFTTTWISIDELFYMVCSPCRRFFREINETETIFIGSYARCASLQALMTSFGYLLIYYFSLVSKSLFLTFFFCFFYERHKT